MKDENFVSQVLSLATEAVKYVSTIVNENTGSRSRKTSSCVQSTNLPVITLEQVSYHDDINDCWMVVYDRIYDVTDFLHEHPGGDELLLEYAGRDATIAFRSVGHSDFALVALQRYLIGVLPDDERMCNDLNELSRR